MKNYFVAVSFFVLITLLGTNGFSQNPGTPSPPSKPKPELASGLAEKLARIPQQQVSRERREKAFKKLLEGQRYLWSMRRLQTGVSTRIAGLAKEALEEAVELNPKLAEAYTALSELSLIAPPQDIDEAIMLAQIAVGLDGDNFGGHRILARLFTIKSNLGRGRLISEPARSAITSWKEISRLDPRNAEAWGFLSEFYKSQNKQKLRIEALRNWWSAATPLEPNFFNNVMRRSGKLDQENASLKLGSALLENGDSGEALEVLSRTIADNPRNLKTIELFKRALDGAEKNSLLPAIEALRQAVFVNPENESLIQLLAQTLAKIGEIDDAAKVLRGAVAENVKGNKDSASNLQVILGDIFADSKRTNEAILAYEDALKIRGIGTANLTTDDDRDFAIRVVSKMIQAYRSANRGTEAKLLIDKYRIIFGKDDLFADKELVSLLREGRENLKALKIIQKAKNRYPKDYNLIRTEASILTDMGRVDEGVSLIEKLIKKKPSKFAPSIMYDDYVNYIFISSLYNQVKRTDEAILTATRAFQLAEGKDRQQIANLSLASAFQTAGEFNKAEKLLKQILEETPGFPIALNNLGYLYLIAGKNYQEALNLIAQAVEIEPTNSSYLDSLGWAHFKLGNYQESKKFLEKAVSISPNSPTILEHLGDVYQKMGHNNQAKTIWQRALTRTYQTEEIERIKTKLNR